MSSEKNTSLIKTPRQLITLIVLAFVVPVILIILLATFVAGQRTEGAGSDAMTAEAIAERLRPVGTVVLASAPSGPRTLQSGEAVYKLACVACHGTGAAGAPKLGDTAAWAPRVKQGADTLFKHAVDGFKAMPPRGGSADLDSLEVARAVVYMANQSGAKFKEPAAPAPATTTAARTGEQIVQQTCGNCHVAGLNGAPRIGDRAAWTKRASGGIDAAVAAAIKGHGGMPARGGMADLTDPELKSAVQYMFNQSTAAPVTVASSSTAAPAATPAASAASATVKPDGAKVYAAGCNACHASGVAGAPRFGDKAAWAPRIKAGTDGLLASVVKGKGAMPPKGGQSGASDADLRAAIEYMVAAAR